MLMIYIINNKITIDAFYDQTGQVAEEKRRNTSLWQLSYHLCKRDIQTYF